MPSGCRDINMVLKVGCGCSSWHGRQVVRAHFGTVMAIKPWRAPAVVEEEVSHCTAHTAEDSRAPTGLPPPGSAHLQNPCWHSPLPLHCAGQKASYTMSHRSPPRPSSRQAHLQGNGLLHSAACQKYDEAMRHCLGHLGQVVQQDIAGKH